MIVADVTLKKFYPVYANHVAGKIASGGEPYQYYCVNCEQDFAAAWGRASCMGWAMRGSHFHCPHCGTEYSQHLYSSNKDEWVPTKLRLAIKAYANMVDLEVNYEAFCWHNLLDKRFSNGSETFRFNIEKHTAEWQSRTYDADSRLRNPFINERNSAFANPYDLTTISKSILQHIVAASMPDNQHRATIIDILRTLRDEIGKRIEKRTGRKTASLFVTPGTKHGMMLIPLLNMGYRVCFPDAPNLPREYADDEQLRLWRKHMADNKFPEGWFERAQQAARKGTDHITAVIVAMGLPNKDAVRREIAANPFEVGRLYHSFRLCENYDMALRLHRGFKQFSEYLAKQGSMYQSPSYTEIEDLRRFLTDIRTAYDDAGLVQMVESTDLKDSINLFNQLTPENKAALLTGGVRTRDMHDWLSVRHYEQQHPNIPLKIPEHVVRRMSMQTDRLKFFLPKESAELVKAGARLHNCVASYGKAIATGQKWIVLISDDNGKLVACLEGRGDKLVQAKLDRNKPVRNNKELNREIIAWAEKAKLAINTNDIELLKEEAVDPAIYPMNA